MNMLNADVKQDHDDDGDGLVGDDAPEEQKSWQVESVSLTPQHSAARPRRVMYDLEKKDCERTQGSNLTPMRMRRTRR